MAASDVAREARRAETRPTPRIGDDVLIVHLAALEPATIVAVHDEGRRVEVLGEEGETPLEFGLRRSTARFTSRHGLRLRWATE
jgi:hypothetical protein